MEQNTEQNTTNTKEIFDTTEISSLHTLFSTIFRPDYGTSLYTVDLTGKEALHGARAARARKFP